MSNETKQTQVKPSSMLGIELAQILPQHGDWSVTQLDIAETLTTLMELSDEDVLRVLTFLMAASFEVTSPLIDGIAGMLGTNMSKY
jgi:hypothetical protein